MKNKNKKETNVLAMHPRQGGRREGAGRPKGTGKYGEPTMAIRVPESWGIKIQSLLQVKQRDRHLASALVVTDIWQPKFQKETALPLFTHKIAAGFPSPAEDHIEASLDLNEYLIEHPAATFYVRVEGESMLNAGIYPNDILIVDRALEPTDGKIVIAALNGELTVKRLKKLQQRLFLLPENEAYKPIEITPEMDCKIWGVVTNVIHRV